MLPCASWADALSIRQDADNDDSTWDQGDGKTGPAYGVRRMQVVEADGDISDDVSGEDFAMQPDGSEKVDGLNMVQ